MTAEPLSFNERYWHAAKGPHIAHVQTLSRPLWLDYLMEARGIVAADVSTFLRPSLGQLLDPSTMQDMEIACARILRARARKERIIIYGDYDVDGVCATSLLLEFFRATAINASFYIPDRRAEGYGLNQSAIRSLEGTCDLLITVDCGSTSIAEIALAKKTGIDVIVVDHHQLGKTLPGADACLNPNRPDCAYGFKGLAATGVAFMLAIALRRCLREANAFLGPEPDLRALTDLVALATVADMVPLTEANRALTAAGLRRIRESPRPGILALCHQARVDVSRIGASDIAYRLGPRINARGRMRHAGLAVDLMLASSLAEATPMAQSLEEANTARRRVERITVDAALRQVEGLVEHGRAGLVVRDETWHPGVLGLVASRLMQRFHRPVAVIGEGGKGSCRSVSGVNLVQALEAAKSHLSAFGGHPAAAGLTLRTGHHEAFSEAFAAAVYAQRQLPPAAPPYAPDLSIAPEALTLDCLRAFDALSPFGIGNPEPLLIGHALEVTDRRIVGEDHLKLKLALGRCDAMGFGMGALLPRLPAKVDALFFMERNVWQGRESLQLRLVDIRAPAGLKR